MRCRKKKSELEDLPVRPLMQLFGIGNVLRKGGEAHMGYPEGEDSIPSWSELR